MPAGVVATPPWVSGAWSDTAWAADAWGESPSDAGSGLSIEDGGLIVKDPTDVSVYVFNWDDHLATGALISTSTFTITALRPSSDTALTKDQASIVTGSRTTQLRISAGTLGALYRLDNTIVTDETPARTKERSVFVTVEQR